MGIVHSAGDGVGRAHCACDVGGYGANGPSGNEILVILLDLVLGRDNMLLGLFVAGIDPASGGPAPNLLHGEYGISTLFLLSSFLFFHLTISWNW